jgi:mitochondrial fission protein ELM1
MASNAAFQPDIWILLSHAPGDNDQCLALAEALHRPTVIKHVDWPIASHKQDRAIVRDLLMATDDGARRRRAIGLHAPWPSLVICSGRRTGRVAFWIKRQSGGRTRVVSIGRARRPIASYDLLVAPPQFALPERSNVINLPLPLTRRRIANDDHPAAGAGRSNIVPVPKPWFTILLGGEVKQFETSKQALIDVARRAQAAADLHGGSVVVTTSRRTPPSLLAALEGVLDRPHIHRWSSATDEANPYEVLLRQSAALFVTADSASMILDGCGSGTPTFVIEYPERPDLRRRWQRDLFRSIRHAGAQLHQWGLRRAGARLDRAQDWLHARGILPYPKDLRLIHRSVYQMELARPVAFFDPTTVPARKAANDLAGISGIEAVAARCRALHDGPPRRAAE